MPGLRKKVLVPGARISESLCAGHNLRADKLGLVEEFIVEFEGARKDCDITRWGQFADIKDMRCLRASTCTSRSGLFRKLNETRAAHEEIYEVFVQNPCRCPRWPARNGSIAAS